MIYDYQALNKKGQTVSNIVDAPNEAKAKEKLRAQGLYVVKILPHLDVEKRGRKTNETVTLKLFYQRGLLYINQKMSAKHVGIFSRQLSTLVGAGLPLLRAITDILEQTDNQTFKRMIADIKEKLEGGMSFSNCLARHSNVFSEMYINMVRVGESLGSLDEVIERLADIEEKRNILKSKIQSAMWYPAFMIFFSIAIVIFLMVKIIPSLTEMFLELGKELPMPTRVVMGLSNFLSSYLWLLILVIIAVAFYINRYLQTPEGKIKFDKLKMTMPIINKVYNKLIVLRFTQNLGILLNNNVDILKSFEIVKKIVSNSIIEDKIDSAAKKIKEGASVTKALDSSAFLPKMVIGMISAGEASDSLDKMLLKIGQVYETEIDLTITSMTNLIEPIIIVIMGMVIGSIVIAVILPIMEMNLMVQ